MMTKMECQSAPVNNWKKLAAQGHNDAIKMVVACILIVAQSIWPSDLPIIKNTSNRCLLALEKIDPSHCVVIDKMYRQSKVNNKGQHKLYTLFNNDSATIRVDSASIILDLKDEIGCEPDSNSDYSKSVRRIIGSLINNDSAIPLTAMDSTVLLNAIISLSSQDLLVVPEGYPEVYSISRYAIPSCLDPYIEVATLSIRGIQVPHYRKFAVRYEYFE